MPTRTGSIGRVLKSGRKDKSGDELMEYYRALVTGSDKPEIQRTISDLSVYDDILFVMSATEENPTPVVSCLREGGRVQELGKLNREDTERIKSKYGDNVAMYVHDFGTYRRSDGSYRLWIELDIRRKKRRGNASLPLLIGAGAFTGLLTLAVVAIKLYLRLRRKNR